MQNKNLSGNTKELAKVHGADEERKVICTDNSIEFGKSCEDFPWNHCTSTFHRSETNEIAERAVRRIKEATSAVLLQSGLDEKWSADTMECYCHMRNIQDLLSDGKTPYERRFGEPLKGPVIPFGSWQNITLFLPKTCRDCTNSARKSCHVYSLDMRCTECCEGHRKITSIWSKSLARYIPWIRIARGVKLERRHLCRRH